MEGEPFSPPPSLKHTLRQTLCLSCCFGTHRHRDSTGPLPSFSSSDESSSKSRLSRASTSMAWLRTRAAGVHELPHIKEKCFNLINRIGKHHHRKQSSDFRYDPLSYSLNFEDGYGDPHLDETSLRNFTARLPASPPLETATAESSAGAAPVSREIVAVG